MRKRAICGYGEEGFSLSLIQRSDESESSFEKRVRTTAKEFFSPSWKPEDLTVSYEDYKV